MTFTPYRDHAVIRVDIDAAHRTKSGLWLPDWQRGDRDPVEGVVLAAPQGLSHAVLPYPDMDGNRYTMSDLVDIPQSGETVYLKYNSLKPDMENPAEPGVFIVNLERIVAVKSAEGVVRPFQGLLLGEEVWGDDVRVNERGQRERVKLTDMGETAPGTGLHFYNAVVLETDPLPIPFTLRVTHAGQPMNGQAETVAVGDVVTAHRMLYAYHAVKNNDGEEVSGRWMWQPPKVLIDGREMVFVPRQCVMGKVSQPVPAAPVTV